MGKWVRSLAHDSQLRWVGPEKGIIHMAVAAIVNAFWDLWAKMEQKPVWKLLVDMSPEQIVSLIDFRYIDDCLSPTEALAFLKNQCPIEKKQRETQLFQTGYKGYTTQIGWLGYPDDKIRSESKKFLDRGFDAFKLKVGSNLEDDIRRLRFSIFALFSSGSQFFPKKLFLKFPKLFQIFSYIFFSIL
jgi:L-fuconate dehydratase